MAGWKLWVQRTLSPPSLNTEAQPPLLPPPQVENNFLTLTGEADDLIGLFPSLAFIEKLQFIIG